MVNAIRTSVLVPLLAILLMAATAVGQDSGSYFNVTDVGNIETNADGQVISYKVTNVHGTFTICVEDPSQAKTDDINNANDAASPTNMITAKFFTKAGSEKEYYNGFIIP